jgi:hypothetical protein
MAGIQLTTLKTDCGGIGLCDSKMFRWVLSESGGCKSCLSMMLDYWNIPVEAPLSWVNNPENCLDPKVLTVDTDALSDILDLPEDFYQPYSYFKRESDVRSIAYTQELTFTRNFATDNESEISIDSHLTVSGTTTNNVTVRVRLELNSVVVDESYIDFANQDLRHNIHVMWAGNLPANINNTILVKIKNMTTSGSDSPSITLTDYKIKYLGIKKI